MNTRYPDLTNDVIDSEDLRLHREDLLGNARQLDHFGKRFERFMSMQLQKLEQAIDNFEREREAWHRQRDRELAEFKAVQPTAEKLPTPTAARQMHAHDEQKAKAGNKSLIDTENSTSPLLLLIEPGDVSSMQLGLLLFEISKMNREFGGGGVRFEVSSVRLPKRKSKRSQAKPIIGIEAFSYVPLLSYDGSPTRELSCWENFKSTILMSSLLEKDLLKAFKKAVPAPRSHESVDLANESTLRAENANTKCTLTTDSRYDGFFSNPKDQQPKQQQLQRVEDVFRYLEKEYGLRMHMSLVW